MWFLSQGVDVTVFEMGRGAGGRMATRKTREFPGLAINHGDLATSYVSSIICVHAKKCRSTYLQNARVPGGGH